MTRRTGYARPITESRWDDLVWLCNYLYGGSFITMLTDLRRRLGQAPYQFALHRQIELDIEQIERRVFKRVSPRPPASVTA